MYSLEVRQQLQIILKLPKRKSLYILFQWYLPKQKISGIIFLMKKGTRAC